MTTSKAGVQIMRAIDPPVIERILARDYFDDPIPSMSAIARHFLARWYARHPEILFLTAEADGEYAGFLFGHALGERFWRRFAWRHPWLLPWLIAGRHRFKSRPRRWPGADRPSQTSAIVETPCLDRPFAWSEGRCGRVILVWVPDRFRGRAIAQHLIVAFSGAMAAIGVGQVEAHIDDRNAPSVRAFQKAGWSVFRMAGRDFWAHMKIER